MPNPTSHQEKLASAEHCLEFPFAPHHLPHQFPYTFPKVHRKRNLWGNCSLTWETWVGDLWLAPGKTQSHGREQYFSVKTAVKSQEKLVFVFCTSQFDTGKLWPHSSANIPLKRPNVSLPRGGRFQAHPNLDGPTLCGRLIHQTATQLDHQGWPFSGFSVKTSDYYHFRLLLQTTKLQTTTFLRLQTQADFRLWEFQIAASLTLQILSKK